MTSEQFVDSYKKLNDLVADRDAWKARAEKAEAELLVDKAIADEAITILADRDRLREALRRIATDICLTIFDAGDIANETLAASEAKEPQVAAVTHDMNCKKLNIHGAECTCVGVAR